MAVVKVSEIKNYLPAIVKVTMPKGKTKTKKITK